MKSITAIVLILVFSLGGHHQTGNKPGITPAAGDFSWEHASPESQGMSSSALNALVKSLSEKGTKKLLIIKNDRIVCEWFAEGFADKTRGHYSASLAKALVGGMSLAMAMSDGYIDPDEPACDMVHQRRENMLAAFFR